MCTSFPRPPPPPAKDQQTQKIQNSNYMGSGKK